MAELRIGLRFSNWSRHSDEKSTRSDLVGWIGLSLPKSKKRKEAGDYREKVSYHGLAYSQGNGKKKIVAGTSCWIKATRKGMNPT